MFYSTAPQEAKYKIEALEHNAGHNNFCECPRRFYSRLEYRGSLRIFLSAPKLRGENAKPDIDGRNWEKIHNLESSNLNYYYNYYYLEFMSCFLYYTGDADYTFYLGQFAFLFPEKYYQVIKFSHPLSYTSLIMVRGKGRKAGVRHLQIHFPTIDRLNNHYKRSSHCDVQVVTRGWVGQLGRQGPVGIQSSVLIDRSISCTGVYSLRGGYITLARAISLQM